MLKFLMKIRDGYARFMYGRYGFDKLVFFLLILSFVLSLISSVIFGFTRNIFALLILRAVSLIPLALAVFRVLSVNTHKRYTEGQRFDAFLKRITDFFKITKNRFRDRKTHVYRRCKNCSSYLRFKKVRGVHTSNCPKCGSLIKVRIL